MATGTTLSAPHGGIFVFFAIGNLLWFLVALAAGTVVGALCVTLAKEVHRPAHLRSSDTAAQPAVA